MSHLRYIVASLVLLTSGIYLACNVSGLSQASDNLKQSSEETVLDNTFFTLDRATNNLYLQKLAESIATEVLGRSVQVVVE